MKTILGGLPTKGTRVLGLLKCRRSAACFRLLLAYEHDNHIPLIVSMWWSVVDYMTFGLIIEPNRYWYHRGFDAILHRWIL